MKNKQVGYLIIAISILIGIIIYLFNQAITEIAVNACTHGMECPMWEPIKFQNIISLVVMGFVTLIGVYLLIVGRKEEIKNKTPDTRTKTGEKKNITKKAYQELIKRINEDEKVVLDKVVDSEGVILQSHLLKDLGLSKAKLSRILDRLEGKGIIDKKRRGMTNVIILKHN